jgi:GLPGLI family protein
MKYFPTVYLILFSFSSLSQESKYAFFYQETVTPDSTDLNAKSSELNVLFSDGSESVYQSYPGYKMAIFLKEYTEKADQIGRFDPEDFMEARRSMEQPKSSKIVHKSLVKGEVKYFDDFLRHQFYFIENLPPFEWEILESNKEILGRSCRQAKTSFAGREYIAWFTEDIPINDGPLFFYGLPGLILEIYDTKRHYHFEIQSIENKAVEMSALILDNAMKTSGKNLFETKKRFFQDVSLALGDHPNMQNPEIAKQVQERHSKANNPLVLKWEN